MYYIVLLLDFMKRFISILLCLSILLGIFAIDVFAVGSQYYCHFMHPQAAWEQTDKTEKLRMACAELEDERT